MTESTVKNSGPNTKDMEMPMEEKTGGAGNQHKGTHNTGKYIISAENVAKYKAIITNKAHPSNILYDRPCLAEFAVCVLGALVFIDITRRIVPEALKYSRTSVVRSEAEEGQEKDEPEKND